MARQSSPCRRDATARTVHLPPALAVLAAGCWGLLLFGTLCPQAAEAAKITMLDGRILEGRVTEVSGVAEDPENPSFVGPVQAKPIVVVDDGLRRTFVSQRRVREVNEIAPTQLERIHVPQRVAESGHKVGGVGPIMRITPFDEFGRRIFTMRGTDGPIPIVQGITEVTPIYTKVEGLQGRRPFVWEMRIATSSIPRDTLSKILHGVVDPARPDGRLQIVRLYVQSQRYKDAREELESVIADFPDLEELEREVRALRQMGSRRLLEEIQMRAAAGQHDFTVRLLAAFPSEGVAGETLQEVREIQQQYNAMRARGEKSIELLDAYIATIDDQDLKYRAEQVRNEIKQQLGYDTLSRMESFLRLAEDAELTARQKLALGVSGWLIGGNSAIDNLEVALSLYEVRQVVTEYLRADHKQDRLLLLAKLEAMEQATPGLVAKLLAHMKPPQQTEPQESGSPGLFTLQVPGMAGELDVNYHVQLPPEYDPLRKYPTILTLNGTGTTPLQQIDWWAGAVPGEKKQRLGQATRHGYIVIAVEWLKPHQRSYKYSAREHHAVLASLRDACRRFSIDTDRVFLTGHSVGGNAVWDIGLAHPDLWAGVIPIVAVSDRYCAHYWENAEHVPFYVVAGEMDGDKMHRNARDLDRYLRRGFDCTVVEYQGRGHEHFYDEVQQIFDWMNLRRRDFFPEEFSCSTMRNWDSYFWWVEAGDFPERAMVNPASWPPPRGTRPTVVSGKIIGDRLIIKAGADRVSVWLSPEIVDFSKRFFIVINGRTVPGAMEDGKPNLQVLLEDARGRADRQHPFWSRVQLKSR